MDEIETSLLEIRKTKHNENYGFNFLRFILVMLLSEFDSYGNRDFLSGILYFGINNNVPVHWKLCLELSIYNIFKDRQLSVDVSDVIAQEVITLFPKE